MSEVQTQTQPGSAARINRSREDWIDAAWVALGTGEVELVRIERLARELGVTKGSFYWHFRDRQKLIEALLDRWFSLREEDRAAPVSAGDPAEQIWNVFERAISRGTHGQAAVLRFWAQRHAEVALLIAAEDDKRLAFMVERFEAMGFAGPDAHVRAQIYMGIISAEFLRSGGQALAERLKAARVQHELLTKQA